MSNPDVFSYLNIVFDSNFRPKSRLATSATTVHQLIIRKVCKKYFFNPGVSASDLGPVFMPKGQVPPALFSGNGFFK
jgi:hypothetical protein